MPSLKKTLVYFLPVQVKKAKDSEIFATKRKMCWLRKGPDGQGVWEGGNTVRILFANPIHYTYREHITKAMQKRQRNKCVDCKVGLGGQRLQQLFMLESWEKNKWTCTKTNIEEENTENELIAMGLAWQSQPEADTKGVGGQQQLLMLGYAFYLPTQHPMQSIKETRKKICQTSSWTNHLLVREPVKNVLADFAR